MANFLQMGDKDPVDVMQEGPHEEKRTDQDERKKIFVL
jgi:hypothetical protein